MLEPTQPELVDELFIEVDEDHVAMQDGTNQHMRLTTLYTHKEAVGTRRVQLRNKHSFATLATAEIYNTYLPFLSAPMPGIENKRNTWLKIYRDVGFQKLMQFIW